MQRRSGALRQSRPNSRKAAGLPPKPTSPLQPTRISTSVRVRADAAARPRPHHRRHVAPGPASRPEPPGLILSPEGNVIRVYSDPDVLSGRFGLSLWCCVHPAHAPTPGPPSLRRPEYGGCCCGGCGGHCGSGSGGSVHRRLWSRPNLAGPSETVP